MDVAFTTIAELGRPCRRRELMADTSRGPLHGVPYALEDIIETAAIPTAGRSKLRRDYVPAADADIVIAAAPFAEGWCCASPMPIKQRPIGKRNRCDSLAGGP